jgi:hypothetical protein
LVHCLDGHRPLDYSCNWRIGEKCLLKCALAGQQGTSPSFNSIARPACNKRAERPTAA